MESPLVVTLELLRRLTIEKSTLSDLFKPLKRYYATGELNFSVKNKEEKLKQLEQSFSNAKRVYHLDGLSVEYEDFWFNVRPSNTEPLLRLNLEAKTRERMEEMKQKVVEILEERIKDRF